MDEMISGAKCYHSEIATTNCPETSKKTEVIVEMNDCIVTAERHIKSGYNTALLNFASFSHPGGGVITGARAQEETICRRSTLTRSIFSFDANYASRFGYEPKNGKGYPLDNLNFSAIYSPAVIFFREGGEYRFMETPFKCAVITCAALNLRDRLTPTGEMPEKAKNITRNKIRTILRIALTNGHDSLVLGAFGCGAFKNPPRTMATLFKEILSEQEFKNRFRLISFSIIEDHNSNNANFNAFKDILAPCHTDTK